MGGIWKPFWAVGRVRPFNDYPGLGLFPAFSARAVDALRGILEPNGELLPFESKLGTYYAYNITTVVDVLDETRTEAARFDDGRIFHIERYAFRANALADLTVFRLTQQPSGAYVTEAFVRQVSEHGLKGFEFVLVWPLPPHVGYMILHKEQKAGRESAELPPGQSLKGNSVIILLTLAALRPTPAERRRVDRLADELDAILVDMQSEAPAVGNLEQIEYTEGECLLSLSCPDAEALVERLRPWLEALEWPLGFRVAKRFGEFYDVEAEEEYVEELGGSGS